VSHAAAWPALSFATWNETCDTLHAHTQVLGKLAVETAPPEPQLQHAALRLSARGWETLALPASDRSGAIVAALDLRTHEAVVEHVYPREDVQAAAAARFADELGAERVAVLSDAGYGETQGLYFARAARKLGLDVVTERRWPPDARGYAGSPPRWPPRAPTPSTSAGCSTPMPGR
jgi:hypothetical protein